MQFPITIGLHRSRFLGRLLLSCAVATTAGIWAFPRSTGVLALFLFLCWGLFFLAYRRLSPGFEAIRLERDGRMLAIRSGLDEPMPMRLLPESTVHPWLVSFRVIGEDGRKHSVLLTAETLSAEDFRRLRVFLRWRADFSEADGDAE